MKKRNLLIISVVLFATGCSSGVSQEDYDALVVQASEAQVRYDELDSSYSQLNSSYNEINSSLESVSQEFDLYKESMQEYEGLSEVEASSRKIDAESKVAEESAAIEASKIAEEESKAAEEAAIAASLAAEEARGYETGITYDQLARTPDDYEGEKVKFTGKVVQVLEGSGTVEIRLAVNKNYDTIIYGSYDSSIVASRVLDDDIITIYGVSKGLLSYQSTMGGTITIPQVGIDKIDQ